MLWLRNRNAIKALSPSAFASSHQAGELQSEAISGGRSLWNSTSSVVCVGTWTVLRRRASCVARHTRSGFLLQSSWTSTITVSHFPMIVGSCSSLHVPLQAEHRCSLDWTLSYSSTAFVAEELIYWHALASPNASMRNESLKLASNCSLDSEKENEE
jgi:hypothetical protein